MELVHVYVVDAEPFDAAREGHADVLRVVASADLGAEGDLVAAAAGAHPASDDLLGRAHIEGGLADVIGAVHPLAPGVGLSAAVDLAGVEEGDAVLDGVVHDTPRGILVDFAAPVAGAESEGADGNVGASELAGFHAAPPRMRSLSLSVMSAVIFSMISSVDSWMVAEVVSSRVFCVSRESANSSS